MLLQASSPIQISRCERAIAFVDIVEFVRHTEKDEIGTIQHWLELVGQTQGIVLPEFRGRMMGLPGDGMLLIFDDVEEAVKAARIILLLSDEENRKRSDGHQLFLRIGIDHGSVVIDGDAVFGHAINLTHRIAGLAGPGEIFISDRGGRRLKKGDLVEFEDVGECYVKHVTDPVHVLRLKNFAANGVAIEPPQEDVLPVIVVSRFRARNMARKDELLGRMIADLLANRLRHSSLWTVVPYPGKTFEDCHCYDEMQSPPGALLPNSGRLTYLVSGTYDQEVERGKIEIDIVSPATGQVVWRGTCNHVLNAANVIDVMRIDRIATQIGRTIPTLELAKVRSAALPGIENGSLFTAAISLMHRLSRSEYHEALELLQIIKSRSSRQSLVNAWLATWHLLNMLQGWSYNEDADGRKALQLSREALETDPDCSFALAISGFVHTHVSKRFDIAAKRFDQAIEANADDPTPWLLKGTLHTFMGDCERAVDFTGRALAMAPPDATRYFYDSLAASAFLAAGMDQDALKLASRSLRINAAHTSTLRVKAVAEWRLGLQSQARATVTRLARVDPDFTVSKYLQRNPGGSFAIGREVASILKKAGVPA